MIEAVVSFLEAQVIPLGGLGIFLASIIEEVIAPIPSALVLLTGSFLFLSGATTGDFFAIAIPKIIIPAVLGITIGSFFIYGLTYYFGRPFIEKYGKWFGLKWSDVEAAEKKLSKGLRDEVLIFITRAVPIIPSVVISGLSGIIRIPFRAYVIGSISGTAVRALVFSYLGWKIGGVYYRYVDTISRFEDLILVGVVLAITFWLLFRRFKLKTARKNSI